MCRAVILVKLSAADGAAIKQATASMSAAATEENKQKKARESAKAIIVRELKTHRPKMDPLDKLPAGEFVLVQVDGKDVIKIDRREAQRLDGDGLKAAHPEIVEKFTGPSVASYFLPCFPG